MEFLRDGNNDEAGSRKETKRNRKWLTWFKFIGELHKWGMIYISERFIQFLSEKKVLFCVVLLLGGLYSAVAAHFYLH